MPRRRQWLEALLLVVATRALLLAVAAVAAAVDDAPGGWDVWRRWDANLYLEIAEHGYHAEPTDSYAEAFYPLYPLLVRALLVVGVPAIPAGMLVTFTASVVAVAYLIRMAEDRIGAAAGTRAALYLLLAPTAVFLAAPYTEALFLAGAIPAFHHAHRGEWAAAALPAAVAAGTRVVGLFVLLGLGVMLVQQWQHRREASVVRQGVGALAVGVMPVAAYLGWLLAVRGDPLYFVTAQREGWGRTLTAPWDAWQTTVDAARFADGWLAITWRAEIVGLLAGCAVLVVAIRRRDWPEVAFIAPTVGALALSSWYYSTPRVLLSLFPLYLYLARWTRGSTWRHATVLAISAPIALVGTVAFTRAHWYF